MSNWNPISDYVIFSTKGITPKYVDSSSIVVLNQKCIRNHKIDYALAQYTDDSKKIAESKFVRKGDLLVNSTGQGTAGRCAFVSELPEGKRLIVDSHILILRCETYAQAQCLSYILFSFEEVLMSFMTGSSGQSELDKVVLLNLKTKMPTDDAALRKIASILSAIDKKIDLNNKINAQLDATLKTIYDYWFLQLDFPDDSGKPYRSTGGKMVWNEQLKRNIPNEWQVKSLSEITEVSTESIKPFDYPDMDFKHYSIPTFDATGTYGIEKGNNIMSNKFTVAEMDILVAKLNPWFNRVIYSTEENNLISSTEFVVWRSKNIETKNYLFMIARDSSFVSYCTSSAAGTSNSHKRVNPTVMMKYKIAYNTKTAQQFGSKIGAAIKMYAKNQVENKKLSDLRDWLLPMLMNGQVKVAA